MTDCIKAAVRWNPELEKEINNVILACECKTAYPLNYYALDSRLIPDRQPQEEVALEIITIEGSKFLRVVDKCTGWSETYLLPRKDLKTQIAAFKSCELHDHGPPATIYGNNEFNITKFKHFCADISANSSLLPLMIMRQMSPSKGRTEPWNPSSIDSAQVKTRNWCQDSYRKRRKMVIPRQ